MMMLAYQRQDVERSLNHSGIYKDIVSLWNQVCESQASVWSVLDKQNRAGRIKRQGVRIIGASVRWRSWCLTPIITLHGRYIYISIVLYSYVMADNLYIYIYLYTVYPWQIIYIYILVEDNIYICGKLYIYIFMSTQYLIVNGGHISRNILSYWAPLKRRSPPESPIPRRLTKDILPQSRTGENLAKAQRVGS